MRGLMMDLKIFPQPDDVTCGATSQHAVYTNIGCKVSLNKLISDGTGRMNNGFYYKVNKFRQNYGFLLGVMMCEGNIFVVEKRG